MGVADEVRQLASDWVDELPDQFDPSEAMGHISGLITGLAETLARGIDQLQASLEEGS